MGIKGSATVGELEVLLYGLKEEVRLAEARRAAAKREVVMRRGRVTRARRALGVAVERRGY